MLTIHIILGKLTSARLNPGYILCPLHKKLFFVDHLCYFCLVILCFHASMFVVALWSPAVKGPASCLSFMMSDCDVVTFALVSWVRCGS